MRLFIKNVNALIKFFEQISFNFVWNKDSLSYVNYCPICITDIDINTLKELAKITEKKHTTSLETYVIEGTQQDPILSKIYNNDIHTILANTYECVALNENSLSKIIVESCKIQSKSIITLFLEELYLIENNLKS